MGGLQAGVRIHHNRGHLEARSGSGCGCRHASIVGPWKADGPPHGEGRLGASRWRGRCDVQSPSVSVDVIIGRDTLSEGWGVRSCSGAVMRRPLRLSSSVDGGGRLRYRHRMEALQTAVAHRLLDGGTSATRERGCRPSGHCAPASSVCSCPTGSNSTSARASTGALWGAVVWNVEVNGVHSNPITSCP